MTDPVTRAAKRQNLVDRIAEQLTEWGCPAAGAPARAQGLLHLVEQHGWALPTIVAPPLSGRGSTDEGRALARVVAFHTRAGCRCEPDMARALVPRQHPIGCPVRAAYDAGGSTAPDGAADPPTGPQDKIDDRSRVTVPATGFRHSDGMPS